MAALLMVAFNSHAQLHIGLSANIGNWLSYTPNSPGLKTPPTISGSLNFAYIATLKNERFIQFGADVGVLGYLMWTNRIDTFPDPYYDDPEVFGNYSAVYGNLSILAGKEIKIGEKTLMLGTGGGVSFYYPDWSSGYSLSIDGHKIFSARTQGPASGAQPFVKVVAQLKPNEKTIVGLGYTHHFNSILEGSYEFYHTATPSSGAIALYPREFNLTFMYRISGKKTVSEPKYSYSENKTYLGLELSFANDLFEITDTGSELKAASLPNTPFGIVLRQDFYRKFYFETGVIWKYFQEGYAFNSIDTYGWESYDPSYLIPFRVGASVNLLKEKIYLVPVIGYSLGVNPWWFFYDLGYGEGVTYGSGTHTDDGSIVIADNEKTTWESRTYSLIQTGLGLDFRLFRTMLFSISANYYSGFNEVMKIDIEYTVNNSSPYTGTATSKGEFWCISTALKYPISNFWTKKKAE